MNEWRIGGGLGQDPKSKTTQSGKLFAYSSVATKEKKDGPVTWVNIQGWSGVAKLLMKFKKGQQVICTGRFSDRVDEDKNHHPQMTLDSICLDLRFEKPKPPPDLETEEETGETTSAFTEGNIDNDLEAPPF